MTDKKTRFFPETQFGGFTDLDGTLLFYSRVNALIDSSMTSILDIGCGRGRQSDDLVDYRRRLRDLRSPNRTIIGIDVDVTAAENPFIDEFRGIRDGVWPLRDHMIDLAVSDNVLEHVPDPESFFDEARRTIRPGGFLCIRTPNKFSYPAIAARMIPNRYHSAVTDRVQVRRRSEDVFPTAYLANTPSKILRLAKQFGFEGIAYCRESEPDYLDFSTIAYVLGLVHLKFAPRVIRPVIFSFLRRVAG